MSPVILCRCGQAHVFPASVADRMAAGLDAAGVAYVLVDDLCGAAARRDPCLAAWASAGAPCVVACHPRAVRGLFCAAEAPLPAEAALHDLRSDTVDAVLRAVLAGYESREGDAEHETERPARGGSPFAADWVPWFPVIDEDRCTGCGQCMDFCLFGVYDARRGGGVRVVHPEACKNNCPACARICPSVAIMFPKLDEEPLNGAAVLDEDRSRENVRVNLDKLLGGDVYSALAERRRRARARRLLAPDVERAMREREVCRTGRDLAT